LRNKIKLYCSPWWTLSQTSNQLQVR